MRRILATALAFAAAAAFPATATAQALPFLSAPKLPNVQQDFYNALPKELQDSPVFAGSSRAASWPKPQQPRNAQALNTQTTGQETQSVADETCANCVAITYDDGPSDLTHQLLDTLKAKQAHASFMVLAPNANSQPDLLRRMKAEGHTVGNHTANHQELTKISPGEVDTEIKAGAAAIKAATGHNPRWMRPPYGATSGTVKAAAKANGQAQALWSVDTVDWQVLNSEQICTAAVEGAQPGAIILMHDIHPTTVEATDCVIDGLRAKGLEPVSLDTLVPNPVPGAEYYRR